MVDDTLATPHGGRVSELFEAEESLDLIPKRTFLTKLSYPPPVSLNGLLIGLLCFLILVMLGFVPVTLLSPTQWIRLLPNHPAPTEWIHYSFQLPFALFLAAFLGPFMGVGMVLLFITTALLLYPLFANGGGWEYFQEAGFGYWLATLFTSGLVSKRFHQLFQKNSGFSRSLKCLGFAASCVLLVHTFATLYMMVLALTGTTSWYNTLGTWYRLSLETAPYDLLAVFTFFCMVRQFRLALWMVLY